MLTQEQTIIEFNSLGVTIEAINGISSKMKKITKLCGTNQLSYAFRYPDDGTNRVYLKNLTTQNKVEIISMMNDISHKSLAIFCMFHNGVIKNLTAQKNQLKKFIKNLKQKPKPNL